MSSSDTGHEPEPLTPIYCERCKMWVPVEREPHIGFPEDTPHRAADHPPRDGLNARHDTTF